MLEHYDILETLQMLEQEHLDIRTVTMGISLVDCACEDTRRFCDNIYDKITGSAQDLVPKTEEIEKKYGIPIINKRVAVTPISIAAAACKNPDFPMIARTLDRAAAAPRHQLHRRVFGPGAQGLHRLRPQADRRDPRVARTDAERLLSVNVATTRAGINMDAIALMGQIVKQAAALTAERDSIGCAKLVVFANAPEDNPFMAGAFHGVGEPERVINVGVSGPGVVRSAIRRAGDCNITEIAEIIKKTAFKITRMGQLVAHEASESPRRPLRIVDLSCAHPTAVGDSVAHILEEIGLEQCGTHGTTACLAILNDAVKKRRLFRLFARRRTFRRVHSRLGGRGHDRRRALRRAPARQARGHDRGLFRRTGYDRHTGPHQRGDDLRHHCG